MGALERYNERKNATNQMGAKERYEFRKSLGMWQNLNEESSNTINFYNTKINNGEWLSTKDLDAYNKAIGDYIDSSNRFREYNKAYGTTYSDEDEKSWNETISSLQNGYTSVAQYYSQFGSKIDMDEFNLNWTRDDNPTVESITARQNAYEANKQRIAELEKSLNFTAGSWLPNFAENIFLSKEDEALRDELEGLRKSNERYEALQMNLDKYYDFDTERFTKSAESGWNRYLSDVEAAKQEEENTPLWVKIISEMGNTADTTLPMSGVTQTITDLRKVDTHKLPNDKWSEEQKQMFGHLYNNDSETAFNYAMEINSRINDEKEEEALKTISEISTSGFWAGAGNTIGAIAGAMTGGADFLYDMAQMQAWGRTMSDGSVSPFEYSQAVTEGISTKLNDMGGTLDESIPLIGGKGWGDVYGLGVEIAKSLASKPLGGTGTLISYFGQGAASSFDDAKKRGATDEQALLYGISNGIFEGLAEKYSIETLLSAKTTGNFIKDLLSTMGKQFLAEGQEEGLTSLLTNIADNVIMQDKSNFNALVRQYIAQGMSESEAQKKAWLDSVEGILYDAIAGGISGGVSGGLTATANHIGYNMAASKHGQSLIQKKSVDPLMQLANDMAGVSKTVDKSAQKVSTNASAKNVGRLSFAMQDSINEQNRAEIEKALTEKGLSKKEAKRVSEYLATNKPTAEQTAEIEGNENIKAVVKELLANPSSSINDRSMSLMLARLGKVYKSSTIASDKAKIGKEAVIKEVNVKDKVSKDGKAVKNSTGEAVTINKNNPIATIEVEKDDNGNVIKRTVYYNTDKGKVASDDISYANETEALLYESFVDMNPMVANGIIKNYDGKTPVQTYINGMREGVLVYGMHNFQGIGKDISSKGFFASLSEVDQAIALRIGRSYATTIAKADGNRIKIKKAEASANASTDTSVKKTAKKGTVTFEEGAKIESHKEDKAERRAEIKAKSRAVDLAKVIAKTTGINIVFYDARNTKYKDGEGANGFFDMDTDTIYLDLRNATDETRTIAYTLSHELVHFIKKWSPTKFDTLAKFLMENYASHGVNSSALLANKMAKNNNDADRAYEEMIADACETMLLDSNAVVKLMELRKADLELFEKIKLHILKILNGIRDAYKSLGYKANTEEGKALLAMTDVLEQMYTLFEDAAVEAVENFQAVESLETEAVQNSNETVFGEASVEVGKTESGVKNQLKAHKSIGEASIAYNDKHKNVHNAILQVGVEAMYEMAETMLPYLEEEGILPPDIPGKTIFKNGSYGKTGENTTLCVRTLTYEDFKDRVAEKIGRPLTVSESLLVSQKIYDIATEPQCIYCYVAADRKAYDENLGKYWNEMDKYIKAMRKGGDSEALYTEYLAGRKDTKDQKKRWSMWESIAKSGKEYISSKDLTTKRKRDGILARKNAFSEQIKDAQRYAQNASWAKTVSEYRAYKGDILKMTSKFVDLLNSEYGLRMYSFSDYTPAFIVENMQMIIDASVKGLKSLAYTKDTDYAEIFASTGQAINVSCFAKWDAEKGKFVEDNRQGANWEKTKNLRKQYRNVGAVMVATNDAMVEWALKQDWVDVVIPYHIVKTGTTIANEYQWNNYTSESADKVGNKNANIYPTEHNNDFATYSNLLNERGITPRFSRWYDMVASGELTDEQYMKLVNEVRLPASELSPVIPSFNLEAAKRSFGVDNEDKVIKGGFVDKGGYMGGWYRQGIDVNQEVMAVSEDIKAGKSSLDVDYGMSKTAKEKVEQRYKKQVKEGSDRTTIDLTDDTDLAKLVDALHVANKVSSETWGNIVEEVGAENIPEATEQYTDVENTTRIKKQKKETSDNTYESIGKELMYYEEGDLAPDLTLVETINDRTGNKEITIKHHGQKPKNYVPKKIAYCYKLFEQHPDGTLHALFAGASNAVPLNEWRYAQGFPRNDAGVKGMNLRERYGWHLSAGLPSAPHLMSSKYFERGYPSKNSYGHPKGSKRVWVRMAYDASTDFNSIADSTGRENDIYGLIPFGGYYAFKENNQSEWVISSAVKIDKILDERERQQILKDAGYDEHEAWRLKYKPTPEEKAARELAAKERAKAKARAKKLGIDSELTESTKAMRETIKSRIIDNPELKSNIKKQLKNTEKDSAYLDAINRGDMETAQKMVDEAAKEAGYTFKGYHGTKRGGFTVFKNRLPGMIEGVKSIFLAKDEGTAGQYAYGVNRKIYTLYAKMDNPLVVDCGHSEATSIYTGNKPEIRELARKYLRDAWETFSPTDNLTTDQIGYLALRSGQYDGVIFKNVNDSYYNRRVTDVYEVFEPEQVKSADTVTYDDNGNVIPLSERFNTGHKDIRYQKKENPTSYAPTFYSHMDRVVEGIKMDKIGAASLLPYLKGKGVKHDEIKWSGIEAFLEGKKSVTKAELQEFLAGSQLHIEEITLTNNEKPYNPYQLQRISAYERERNDIASELKNEWKRVFGKDIPIQHFGAGLESDVVAKIIEAERDIKNTQEVGKALVSAREELKKIFDNDDFGYESSKKAYMAAVRDAEVFMSENDLSSEEIEIFENFIRAKTNFMRAEGVPLSDRRALIDIARKADRISKMISDVHSEHYSEAAKHMPRWGKYKLRDGENYRELLFKLPNSSYSNDAMYVHWSGDIEGVLAHARIQDFNINGKKMLFIEEIQSDWHNEGAKSGYAEDSEAARIEALKAVADELFLKVEDLSVEMTGSAGEWDTIGKTAKGAKLLREYRVANAEYKKASDEFVTKTPDAPFRDTYHEYVLKRLLRMAAEEGYDSIGWTPAVIQDERWSDGQYHEEGKGKSGFLKGYTVEYDQDIPAFLRKYGKKWGATVGKTEVANIEAWSMDITDSMKDSVLYEGQVKYQKKELQDNVGYHAGDLGKAEFLFQQGRGRGTGHFGTGTYFVGDEERISGDNSYGKRPHHAVDFSDYNLYKIKDNEDGWNLHEQLREIDGGFSKEWLEAAINDKFSISNISKEAWELQDKYDIRHYDEELGFEVSDNYRDAQYRAYTEIANKYDVEHKSYEEWLSNEGYDVSEMDDFDIDYYKLDYAKYLGGLFKNIDDTENEQFRRFSNAVSRLRMRFGYRKVENALREVLAYQEQTENDRSNFSKRDDSFATVFMKALGYEGIDVRGTRLDNVEYGSVIYDLKKNSVLYQKKEVSNRTLLANALESTIDSSTQAGQNELEKLKEYKSKVAMLEKEEEHLAEVKSQIDEIMYKKSLSIGKEKYSVKEFERRAKELAVKQGFKADDVTFKLDRENNKYIANVGNKELVSADKTFRSKEDTAKLKALNEDKTITSNKINTLDRQLLRYEAMKPIKDVLEREKELVRKRTEEKGREALEAYKEKMLKVQKEQIGQARELKSKAIARVRETRDKQEARAKLTKLVLDTVKWITHPAKTDVRCPDMLKAPYQEFLESINLDSKRALEGGALTQNDLRIDSAMNSLANVVERIKSNQATMFIEKEDGTKVLNTNVDGFLDLPGDFIVVLRKMADDINKMMVGGYFVTNKMTATEIKLLTKIIRTLNASIKQMNRTYANLRFSNPQMLGDTTISFLDSMGEIEKTNSVKDFVTWDNALPYYAFKKFGEAGESVFEELMDAQDKMAFNAKKILDFKEKSWTDKEASEWGEDTHTILLPSGGSLTLTTADAMGIYCLYRRDNGTGINHLTGGGVRVVGLTKGATKAKDSRANLTLVDIEEIIDSLNDRQKAVAEAIQEFMSTVCSEWGNEISMKRFLTKDFVEKVYYPIESDNENLNTELPGASQSDLYRLLNISATKSLTEGANNRVIIRNIFDVFTAHTSDMARLNAYGMALLDYMKWINYRERTENDNGQIETRGVRQSMNTAYGDKANSYVLNLIKDINGRAGDVGSHPWLSKMARMAKTASVAGNARVMLLQITAYPRAAMVLPVDSLAKGLMKIPQIEKTKKYCGIALWKSFGFFDTNIARSIEDQIKGTKNIRAKLIELSMKGAEYADAITWGALWNACEYEVAKTTKNKVGSEAFYYEVGKKLRDVVYATQVVDSVLTRSQIMRSKDGLTQMATAYMSEPTLTANILMDAGFQFTKAKRLGLPTADAWKHLGRTIGVYTSVAVFTTLIESLADAFRDEDDEEFAEKFAEALLPNLISNVVPFNKLPIIADISDAVQSLITGDKYFTTEIMSSQWITQTVYAINAWKSVLSGKNTPTTVYDALFKSLKAISFMTGLPISNAMRDLVALWNNIIGAIDEDLKID